MSDTEKKQSQKSDESTKPTQDVGQDEVQQAFDEANDQGYFGVSTDPTPNENYTLRGNDLPTPETDDKLRVEARKEAGFR